MALAVVLAMTLAGCGGSDAVDVPAPSPTGRNVPECQDLVDGLPDTVAGEDERDVSPSGALARAWGDPPIVLRCGVDRPSGLRRDSQCFVVDHVGWFADERRDEYVFTTIGRSTYVELTVPHTYAPEADALVDVARAVRSATTWPHPCR